MYIKRRYSLERIDGTAQSVFPQPEESFSTGRIFDKQIHRYHLTADNSHGQKKVKPVSIPETPFVSAHLALDAIFFLPSLLSSPLNRSESESRSCYQTSIEASREGGYAYFYARSSIQTSTHSGQNPDDS